MIKVGLDASKTHTLIYGCPFCDGFDLHEKMMLVWEFGGWLVAACASNQWYAGGFFKGVTFCPCCGKELPSIEGWFLNE
jgi:hypothetical protein